MTKRFPILKKSRQLVFPAIAVVVVFGSLLGIVIVQTFIVQNRVLLDGVSAEISAEQAINQELRLEVIELEAPARILETAVDRLGMIRPEERTYLPGVDPDLNAILQPPTLGDPFGPAPLSSDLEARFGLDEEETPQVVVAADNTPQEEVGTEAGEVEDVEEGADP